MTIEISVHSFRSWSQIVEKSSSNCCELLTPNYMKCRQMNWKKMTKSLTYQVTKPQSLHTRRRIKTRCSQMRKELSKRKETKTPATVRADTQGNIKVKVDINRVMKVRGQGHILTHHHHRVINTTIINSKVTMVEGEVDIIILECTTWDTLPPWDLTTTPCIWECILLPDIHCRLWWSYREVKGQEVILEVIIQDMVLDITKASDNHYV